MAEQDWVGVELLDLVAGETSAVCRHSTLVCRLLSCLDPGGVVLAEGLPELDPETAAWLESVDAVRGVFTFSQARYSVLQPGGTIRPHCGSTNNRLRLHLALQAPDLTADKGVAAIKVNGTEYCELQSKYQLVSIENAEIMENYP